MAGGWNFVAINQTLPHPFFSIFSKRVYVYKKDTAQKNLSIMPLQDYRSFNWSTLWCWGYLRRSSMKTAHSRSFVRRPSSNINSQPVLVLPWLNKLISRPYYRNRVCGNQRVCCHCGEENKRYCFLLYLRKKRRRLSFLILAGILMFHSSLTIAVLFLRHKDM